ncbi:hypothetical protein B0O99DRAFT_611223 [Bisporella sp. PMI_857]|nr:hypothetical protein B0O99DRAFT_611223 [Bisporella sp. PMI_857]
MVYRKLREEGYPTDKNERTKYLALLNIARWPEEALTQRQQQLYSSKVVSKSIGESQTRLSPYNFHGQDENSLKDNTLWSSNLYEDTTEFWVDLPSDLGSIQDTGFETPQTIDTPMSAVNQQIYISSFQQQPLEAEAGDLINLGIDYAPGIFQTPTIPKSEIRKPTTDENLGPFLDIPTTVAEPDVPGTQLITKLAEPVKAFNLNNSQSNGATSARLNPVAIRGRNTLRMRPISRLHRSCTPEKRNSNLSNSTYDSGYESGRSTPLPSLAEINPLHPRSLYEFKGLHRIPCNRLHEPQNLIQDFIPQSQDRFKLVPECSTCHYSAIHNLSWSVKYLKLEVFQLELQLQGDGWYNVAAVDATGNSALHYAAAAGARFEHFHALISAGVNPFHLNTAGQLFIHCLRPSLKGKESEIMKFTLDLIYLMNLFRVEGCFLWPDDEGNRALDALSLRINDHEINASIFRCVTDAGYGMQVPGPYSQSPLTSRCEGQIDGSGSGAAASQSTQDTDNIPNHVKQDKAWRILEESRRDPSYIDPESGNGILHALSFIRPHDRPLVSMIRDFALNEEVDLNLRNRQSEFPLGSFVRQRPFLGVESGETGATMSKYLDALLWKDYRYRVPNKINVNVRNNIGATALYYAAVLGRPDSVRSLIEAGGNVNARLGPNDTSILAATQKARIKAVYDNDLVKVDRLDNVISHLEHENAVAEPTQAQVRAWSPYALRTMPTSLDFDVWLREYKRSK